LEIADRYRLLAAPFNDCPSLFAGGREYRRGALDGSCTDAEDPTRRAPRRYVLDAPPARIAFNVLGEAPRDASPRTALAPGAAPAR
jgi:hypothetical protein